MMAAYKITNKNYKTINIKMPPKVNFSLKNYCQHKSKFETDPE